MDGAFRCGPLFFCRKLVTLPAFGMGAGLEMNDMREESPPDIRRIPGTTGDARTEAVHCIKSEVTYATPAV